MVNDFKYFGEVNPKLRARVELLFLTHEIDRVGKIFNFRLKSPVFSETVRDRPWLLWNGNRKLQLADRSMSAPITLSDLERWDA